MTNFKWFNDKQVRDARQALSDAQDALDNYSDHMKARKDPTETPEFLRLNQAVIDARQDLKDARP